jgi:hypothetical protein
MKIMLSESRDYWKPLTQKSYASKIAATVHSLPYEDQIDLLGQTRKAGKISRENIFICVQWPMWTKNEFTLNERCDDAKNHGIDITHDGLRKRAERLGLH